MGRRSSRPRGRTYKKVLNFLEATFAAGSRQEIIASGVDGVAIGQTTNTDPNVPTGCKIKYIEVQFSASNVTAGADFLNCAFQYVYAGQSFVTPDAVGGNAQRNQVINQQLFSIGTDQNSTHVFRYKIPPRFQRMREGQVWLFTWGNTASTGRVMQVIYKVEL